MECESDVLCAFGATLSDSLDFTNAVFNGVIEGAQEFAADQAFSAACVVIDLDVRLVR